MLICFLAIDERDDVGVLEALEDVDFDIEVLSKLLVELVQLY